MGGRGLGLVALVERGDIAAAQERGGDGHADQQQPGAGDEADVVAGDERARRLAARSARGRAPRGRSVVRFAANVERIASPSAPPICCDVLNRPEARPASRCVDVRRGDQRQRHEREARARADITRMPGQHVGAGTCRHRDRASSSSRPTARDRPCPPAPPRGRRRGRSAAGRRPRHTMIAAVSGRNAEAGLHRREAQDLLHVQRREEEDRRTCRRPRRSIAEFGARQRARPEDARAAPAGAACAAR